jgi:ribosome biogenesis GTPase / thiamine phosphate phosphatase
LRTAEVSEKFDRGKHTTTMGILLPLEDGVTRLIDTPGVRRLALRDIEPDSLVAYFPELASIAQLCAFGLSCTHTNEEGCRIRAAVEAGEVHEDRYESYQRIREELESTFEYRKPEGISVSARRKAARRMPRSGHGDDDDE